MAVIAAADSVYQIAAQTYLRPILALQVKFHRRYGESFLNLGFVVIVVGFTVS
jgi:hypothetical protein